MKLLFCVVDSLGVVHQLVAIGRALEARGHEIAYAANAGIAATLERLGARHLIPPTRAETFQIRDWAGTRATALQLAHVTAAVHAFAPDAIVTSPFGYGPACAALVHDLPIVMAAGVSFLWTEGGYALAHARDDLEAATRMLGLARPDPIEAAYLGHRLLLQGVPALSGQIDGRADVRWVGDCSWDPPEPIDRELAAWCELAAGRARRVVFVQLGREFGADVLDPILNDVARAADLAIVMDTGRSDRPRAHTSERMFARPYVARAHALPRAELVVTTGQPTSVLGALAHGRPMVLIPHGSGTEETALACGLAGVARAVGRNDVTRDRLCELIETTLVDADMRGASAALGEQIAAVGGPDAAAREVLAAIN